MGHLLVVLRAVRVLNLIFCRFTLRIIESHLPRLEERDDPLQLPHVGGVVYQDGFVSL